MGYLIHMVAGHYHVSPLEVEAWPWPRLREAVAFIELDAKRQASSSSGGSGGGLKRTLAKR